MSSWNLLRKYIRKYLKEVYCFLLRLSGDRETAEELTQQTFAIAFEKLENFRGECKIIGVVMSDCEA